jgi:hypothetical protein
METNIFKPIEIKDFVNREYQDQIYTYLTDIKFDWHFMEDTTFERANTPETSTPCFANLLYYPQAECPHLDFFKPLIENIEEQTQLKISNLLRVRAGFLMNTKFSLPSMPYRHNIPHRDYDQEHYVAIYYVNDADGDTVIFRETEKAQKYYPLHKSRPEKGKLLLFNGWHYHASTCPKVFTKRIAITINFTAEKNG